MFIGELSYDSARIQTSLKVEKSPGTERCTVELRESYSLSQQSAYSGKTGIHSDLFIKGGLQELWNVIWQKRSLRLVGGLVYEEVQWHGVL